MPLNPVQFQAGLSLNQFNSQYGTDAQCLDALEKARWSEGFQCPQMRNQGALRDPSR